MKNLWTVFALIFAFSFTMIPMEAEAKKFGGGKSFGKLFKTSPAKKPTADNKANISQPASSQQNNLQSNKAASGKKGMMGGLLGGLLAGGLIGALLGGAFEGIQFMDILIIGLIAFVAFRLFKAMAQSKASSMNRTAYAGAASQTPFERTQDNNQAFQNPQFGNSANAEAQPEPSQDDVPMDLPAGFDINGFLNGACDHYRTLQQAWNQGNLEIIREYTAPQLAEELISERNTLSGEQHTEVMYLDADLVRAHQVFGTAQVSIKFNGRYKDTSEGVEEEITDIWHLERDLKEPNAPWYIIGIEN